MIASTVRSRLFELRRDRAAAARSAELLDHKREVLLREIARRQRARAELREIVASSHREAIAKLAVARVELGLGNVEAAALAQKRDVAIAFRNVSLMGVRVPEIEFAAREWRPSYGAAATTLSLDQTGAAFARLLAESIRLAQEEAALTRLRIASRKTSKLLNALRKVVLPHIEREIRATVEGIEEEERDEAVRRGRHTAA